MTSDLLLSHMKHVEKLFELLMFAGCFVFVIIQGTQCISKWLEMPEIVTTSFDFAGKHPFPEITLCPLPINQLDENYPKPFNENSLEKCGLTWDQYKNHGKWSSEESSECKNSTLLSQKVFVNIDDLQIEFVEIQTFGSIGNPKVHYMNETAKSNMFSWKNVSHNMAEHLGWGNCFTLVTSIL